MKIKKYLEINDNKNTMTQNLWDAAKAVLRWKFIAIQAYCKKQGKHYIKKTNLTPKANWKKNNKKSSNLVEGNHKDQNEKEMKEIIAKTNKMKSWTFEKINKINKPLARLIKKKKEDSN